MPLTICTCLIFMYMFLIMYCMNALNVTPAVSEFVSNQEIVFLGYIYPAVRRTVNDGGAHEEQRLFSPECFRSFHRS